MRAGKICCCPISGFGAHGGFRGDFLPMKRIARLLMPILAAVAILFLVWQWGAGRVLRVADGRIIGAVGVSGAVPADNDHLIADAAAGHPILPSGH